ncbi:MAG: restriction endonuclease subunit S [bacterium]
MSGRYAAYRSYARAGIEWADSLPVTWGSIRLRWGASIYAGGTPSKTNPGFWENGTVPWLNSGSVNQRLIREASAFITKAALENSSARWIKRGSLVVALAGQGKTKGMAAQLDIDATCNQSMAAIVPSAKLQPRFLFWWLSSNYQNLRNMAGGDMRDGLNLQLLGDVQCPLPAQQEQAQIANFLDYETAKIDALIERQQQLVALLTEKRQAVISHAVTKGLNPDALMRDSGVDWIGTIPSHWSVLATSRVSDVTTGGRDTQDAKPDGEYPFFVRSQTVERIDTYSFDGEGVLTSGDGAGVGKIYHHHIGRLEFHQRVYLFHNFRRITGRYFFYFLREHLAIVALAGNAKSTVDSLRRPMLRAFPVCLPPLEEQDAITEFLDERVARIDSLISRQDDVRDLLQERRTALISAAVTGKIDVRNWKPPTSDTSASEPQSEAEVA